MHHDRPWRIGLVWLVLMMGCEKHERPPPPALPSDPVPRSDLDAGAAPAPVPSSSPAEAPVPSTLSSDGRLTLSLSPGDRVRYIDVTEVSSQRRHARITLDPALGVRATGARVRWTPGDHILLTWSAGSDDSSGLVYTPNGKRLLQVSGPGMALSPSLRYLVTYPTLFAAPPVIEVYDVSVGSKVARRVAAEDTFWVVDDLGWKAQQLVIRCRDTQERTQEVRIDLDAAP